LTSEQSEIEEFEGEITKVESNWDEVDFADLMESMRNGIYKKKDFYGSGNQIVKMGELFSSEFIINQEKMDRLELSEKELKKHGLQKGDLLFARRSYVREGSGKCSVVSGLEEPLVPESSIIRARPDTDRVLPKYMYYFFKSPLGRGRIYEIIRQTAVSGIAQSDLKKVRVPVPPKEIQRKIVEVLFSIDKKIRINQDVDDILEGLIQTIFRHWFIEYGPFNDFKDSEVGEIPESFEVVELGNYVNLKRGYSYTSDHLDKENEEPDNYPMINLQNVREGGGFNEDGLKYYTKEEIKERYIVNEGDLVIAITEQTMDGELIGSPSLVPPLFDEYPRIIMSQDVCQIDPSSERLTEEFLYALMKSDRFRSYSESHSSGTTVYHLKLDSVNSFKLAMPPQSKIDEFTNIVSDLIGLKHSNMVENEILENIRDTLLPKLMSGEVRVNDISLDDLEVDSEA